MTSHRFSSCLLLLCMVVLWCGGMVREAGGESPAARYESAKKKMERLGADRKRSSRRDLWQGMADEFLRLYEDSAGWNNRPAALYRSALALEELARRSRRGQDAAKALERYGQLLGAHPSSVLADDALFNSARIEAELRKNPDAAQKLVRTLREKYPDGDMRARAEAWAGGLKEEKAAAASAPAGGSVEKSAARSADSPAPPERGEETAFLRQVAWESRRNQVKIIMQFNRPVSWTVRSQPASPRTGSPIRLLVDMEETMPDTRIRPGVKIADSMLTRLRLDLSTPGTTRMLLDFAELERFSVTTEKSPFRLVITGVRRAESLPQGMSVGSFAQSEEEVRPATAVLPANLAHQLGLSVHSVILDPGHGGRDPGTSHNGIVEREVTLELARLTGAILAAKGMKVHYTRQDNRWISLEKRSRRAHEVKADLFISIHVNANPKPAVSGFETYYLDFASSSEAARLAGVENAVSERNLGEMEGMLADLMLGARTQESRRLARNIQNNTLARLKKKGYATRDGGLKSAPFVVLLGSGMPGVLVEVGYCTNVQEARWLADKKYRTSLAEGIAAGILAYSGNLAP